MTQSPELRRVAIIGGGNQGAQLIITLVTGIVARGYCARKNDGSVFSILIFLQEAKTKTERKNINNVYFFIRLI